ncbi:MAG: ABC transporter substrate-binding protein [Microbacter sp.]
MFSKICFKESSIHWWFVMWLLIPFLLTACHSPAPHHVEEMMPDSSAVIQYAKGFAIDYFKDYERLTVYNPWKRNDIAATYYLVKKNGVKTPDSSATFVIPVHDVAVTSCTHVAFIEALNELTSIAGMTSPELVYSASFLNRYQEGKIINLGDAFHINVEKVLFLHPQFVMMTNYSKVNMGDDQLNKAGIQVVYNNEWKESTPLGRAEWIKFVAAFYDKDRQADSLFRVLEVSYHQLTKLVAKAVSKPSVLIGDSFKGTWYMPSGTGYMGHFLKDAGCSYYFSRDTTNGSIPMLFESVFDHFHHASFWLNCSASSLKALVNSDPRYALFKAFQDHRVYGLNGRVTPQGGNDFWEGAVIHPDLLLRDYIRVLHPELLPKVPLIYLKQLK